MQIFPWILYTSMHVLYNYKQLDILLIIWHGSELFKITY